MVLLIIFVSNILPHFFSSSLHLWNPASLYIILTSSSSFLLLFRPSLCRQHPSPFFYVINILLFFPVSYTSSSFFSFLIPSVCVTFRIVFIMSVFLQILLTLFTIPFQSNNSAKAKIRDIGKEPSIVGDYSIQSFTNLNRY